MGDRTMCAERRGHPGRWRRVLRIAAVAAPLAGATLPAQEVTYTGALRGTTGEYGLAERASNASLVNGLAVTAGRWHLAGALPVTYQSTPWITSIGTGPVATGGPMHDSVARAHRHGRRGAALALPDTLAYDRIGIGDPMIFGSVTVFGTGGLGRSVAVTAAAKAPLADETQGFGTGRWDYAAGVALGGAFGRTSLALDASFWALGDLPGLALRDVVWYSAGAGRTLRDGRWTAFAWVSGATGAIVDGGGVPAEVALALGRQNGAGRSLTWTIAAGLTEASPQLSLAVGWRVPVRSGRPTGG